MDVRVQEGQELRRYLSTGSVLRRNPWLGHGFALIAFGVALVLRFALQGELPPGFPYLTFFPAVIITTFLAGTRPGLVSALLSGLAAWYWFIPPFGLFEVNYNTAIALAFYVFIVGVDISIIDAMVRATERLDEERATSARLAEQHRTLFAELQHRVANNMAFVAALLSLQKRKVAADPAAAPQVFDEAVHRLEVMAKLHRKLHDPAALDKPVGEYLRELCVELLEAGGAKGVTCLVEADDVRLDLSRLTALSLIINEVVTNSLKHAFKGREGGTITLDLKALEGGRYALTIADDGPGMPAKLPDKSSLGLKIVQGLAAQLDGQVSTPSSKGAATRIEFAS
jgi:two-component sensor histidine kinase